MAQQDRAAPDAYARSGVDIAQGDALVRAIASSAKATARPGADAALGGFGGVFDLRAAGYEDPLLVAATDGVGTKLLLGAEADRLEGLGQDLVAMCVNDLVVQGAEPLLFLDYLATSRLEVEQARRLVEGIAAACKESGCALIGGETAEMPGVYPPGGFDLAGFALGAVERGRLLPKRAEAGDVVLGLASSGPHSNGFSLIRKLLDDGNHKIGDAAPFDPALSLADALLEPTRLYVRACLAAAELPGLKAFAHVTGGGITENLPRVLPDGLRAVIDPGSWPLPPVFAWLAKAGGLCRGELARTFNCGIGMIALASAQAAGDARAALERHGQDVFEIGRIEPRAEEQARVELRGAAEGWPQP